MSTERDIGELSARMDNVEKTCDQMSTDIKTILAHVEAAKGGWRMLSTLAVITTTIGAGVATLVGWFRH